MCAVCVNLHTYASQSGNEALSFFGAKGVLVLVGFITHRSPKLPLFLSVCASVSLCLHVSAAETLPRMTQYLLLAYNFMA